MRGVAAALSMSLGVSAVGEAQVQGTLDVGAASIRYADSVRVTATTLAPAIRMDRGPLTALASGSFSAVGDGAWSSQGSLGASLLSRPFGVGRVEVASAGGGTVHYDGTRSGQYLARVRLHAAAATRGLWIGGGATRGWDGSLWRGALEGNVAVWGQHDHLTVVGALRPVVADSVRYTDMTATVRHDATRVAIAAVGGLRSGIAATPGSPDAWASVSAAIWVAPQVGIVAESGSYPADFQQGFGGGRYLSLALRIAPNRRSWARVRELPSTDPVAARTAGARSTARVEVVAVGAGTYAVRVRAPGARRVEIMGDFTEWRATDAAPAANGWWTIVTRITPGARQMNVRLDGGRWAVPAGAATQEDEYGAAVGVVIVR